MEHHDGSSTPTTLRLRVRPWTDPVLDTLGHDPRSQYVESFWLPTLGPTGVMLLRHLADRFDAEPDGYLLDVTATSLRLGLGTKMSANAPLRRCLARLVDFEFAVHDDVASLLVRRHLPPIHPKQARRLPDPLRDDHERWTALERSHPPHEGIRRRARAQALVYFEQGAERDVVERWLERTGFPPRVARDATVWAHQRHADAARTIAFPTSSSPSSPPPTAA